MLEILQEVNQKLLIIMNTFSLAVNMICENVANAP